MKKSLDDIPIEIFDDDDDFEPPLFSQSKPIISSLKVFLLVSFIEFLGLFFF